MATVEKRGKGYRITVAAGIDLNGKQIRHRLNWTPDEKLTPRQVEKELNRQIARFEEQVKTGSIAAEGNIRFADFAERYMDDYGRPNLKPTTAQSPPSWKGPSSGIASQQIQRREQNFHP